MQIAFTPVLGFVAASGTGKTTLLTSLLPYLSQQGLRVGAIKHTHHDFDIDLPGKDSYRLRAAGAKTVSLVSRQRRAVITEKTSIQEPRLIDELRYLESTELDLILVEGFKSEFFPKIELHRSELGHPLLFPDDPNIIAVATDIPIDLPASLVALDINAPNLIAQFIIQWRTLAKPHPALASP